MRESCKKFLIMGKTATNFNQFEAKALRKLRHPMRNKHLVSFYE